MFMAVMELRPLGCFKHLLATGIMAWDRSSLLAIFTVSLPSQSSGVDPGTNRSGKSDATGFLVEWHAGINRKA
jgi:hypothetical protein